VHERHPEDRPDGRGLEDPDVGRQRPAGSPVTVDFKNIRLKTFPKDAAAKPEEKKVAK
jgi:hypothetical protein